MLSHANIVSQLRNFSTYVEPQPGDTTLSLLPPWHIYERTTGYFIFQQGCTQVTSQSGQVHTSLCFRATPLLAVAGTRFDSLSMGANS